MDHEQLKLILDTLRSIADTAGVAGIVWICVHYFVLLVQALAVPVSVAAIFIVGLRQAAKVYAAKQEKLSLDMAERTKQAELAIVKSRVDLDAEVAKTESAKVSIAGKDAVRQLVDIAKAAKVRHSEYSGIYEAKDLEAIVSKVKA
jgi:hypothetical protein